MQCCSQVYFGSQLTYIFLGVLISNLKGFGEITSNQKKFEQTASILQQMEELVPKLKNV